MARLLQNSLIAAATLLALGCTPWSKGPSTAYVTVEPDHGNTKLARREYTIARDIMEKHVLGKECDFAAAEKHLRSALAADVRFGPAHHSLGILYFWQGKWYLAAWEFEYAVRLMPDRFEPLNNLGLVYESAGKYEQAKTFYLLAREKVPHNPEVIANLARASSRNGESVDEIRPVLEDVLATDPRPEWRRWASDQLALNPSRPSASPSLMPPAILDAQSSSKSTGDESSPAEELPAGDEPSPVEELPLLPPPAPEPKPLEGLFDESVLLQ